MVPEKRRRKRRSADARNGKMGTLRFEDGVVAEYVERKRAVPRVHESDGLVNVFDSHKGQNRAEDLANGVETDKKRTRKGKRAVMGFR
jgi:hypothetical protein